MSELKLEANDVHVWQARLDVPPEQWARSLSTDEQVRADRFKFDIHRNRFIVGRGILRSLLSRYLCCAPEQLTFRYGSHGKPCLCDGEIQFNVSHSQDRALYIVSRDRTVGIDIEQIRPMDNLESLTHRFFSPNEHAAICAADPEHQSTLFFRYWTCKEAYLKATGDGLGQLNGLEIALSMTQSAQFKSLPQGSSSQNWHLQELNIEDGFVGAIAVQSTLVTLQKFIFR